jgi:hypothetical protein
MIGSLLEENISGCDRNFLTTLVENGKAGKRVSNQVESMDDEHENIPGSQVEFGELHESGEPILRERACRAKDESLDVESTHEEGYEEYGKGEEVYEGKEEHEWEEPGWEHAFEDSYEREEGYIRTMIGCFLSPCYCNIRYCIRCINAEPCIA